MRRRLRRGMVPARSEQHSAELCHRHVVRLLLRQVLHQVLLQGAGQQRHNVGKGFAIFQYPNEDRASTKYHDHTQMTRLNVYAGPAGFYLLGGPEETRRCWTAGMAAWRCSRARRQGRGQVSVQQDLLRDSDRDPGPLVQRRRVAVLPRLREFFDGIVRDYIPHGVLPDLESGILRQHDHGQRQHWPFQTVEQRRYRFRFLNGCQSRFLILDFQQIPGVEVWAIGNEERLPLAPVNLTADNNSG